MTNGMKRGTRGRKAGIQTRPLPETLPYTNPIDPAGTTRSRNPSRRPCTSYPSDQKRFARRSGRPLTRTKGILRYARKTRTGGTRRLIILLCIMHHQQGAPRRME
jgi:hypothetical protein